MQVREWVTGLARFAKTAPCLDAAVYSGRIAGFEHWGVEGAIHYLLHNGDLPIHYIDDAESASLLQHDRVALLRWSETAHRMSIVVVPGSGDSFLEIGKGSCHVGDELVDGWYPAEGAFRWTAPVAMARLLRPEGARQFVLRISVVRPVTARVSLNDSALEPRQFTGGGSQEAVWELPPGPAGPVRVTLRAEPEYHAPGDARALGLAAQGLGFR
jgi:hypothetical protein